MRVDVEADEPLDGRTARAVRTRDAIVDATIGLVDDGDLRPTAPRIAERAAVSVRSVFQHFDDLESLFAAVAERLFARMAAFVATVDPRAPRDERIVQLAHQRSHLLEVITPIRRAANVHAPFSAEVAKRLQDGHDFLRHEVGRIFAAEIEAAPAADSAALLDAVDTILSWPTWDNLRGLNHRSADDARDVVVSMLRAVLADAAHEPSQG